MGDRLRLVAFSFVGENAMFVLIELYLGQIHSVYGPMTQMECYDRRDAIIRDRGETYYSMHFTYTVHCLA